MIIITFSPVYIACQEHLGDQYVIWSIDKKLSWDDFNSDSAIQNPSRQNLANPAAVSSLNVITQIRIDDNKVVHIVIPFFDRTESWRSGNLNPERSSILLSHEQIHFNIYEYTARRIRYALDSLDNKELFTIEEESERIVNDYLDLKDRLNHQFDIETSFGKNTEAQLEWENKISRFLDQYQQYSTDYSNHILPQLLSILNDEKKK